MKRYNEVAAARMNSTSALFAALPEIFTAKEYSAKRSELAKQNSGMRNPNFRYIPRDKVAYTLNGLREIGVLVIARTEPVNVEVEVAIRNVYDRKTGEVVFTGTDAECDDFVGENWRHLNTRFHDWETREITVQRHYYSVDFDAYRRYIRETFEI